jgi:L-ascorbate metabolism protein UlaG (beta-lactamase superfamily)
MPSKTRVTFFGHSMFLIESSSNTIIVTDPYNQQVKDDLPRVSADIVLVSHQHFDHNNTQLVKGSPEIIDSPGDFKYKDINIKGLSTFHDRCRGKERGKNTVFEFEADGIVFAHLGDLGHMLKQHQLDSLKGINVLMIPVGGKYTIEPDEAAGLIQTIGPNIAIPMHYKQDDTKIDVAGIDKFLKAADSHRAFGRTVQLEAAQLPAETEIWILKAD